MIQQFYHEFMGYGIHPSRIIVKIFSDDEKHFICFEDIGDGTSVTNASEQLASEIINKMEYDPDDCKFFETYKQYDYDTFDEINYQWSFNNIEFKASKPVWIPADKSIKKMFIK